MIKQVYVNCSNLDVNKSTTPEFVRTALFQTARQREENWQNHPAYHTETAVLVHIKNGDPEKMAAYFGSRQQEERWYGDFSDSDLQQVRILFVSAATLYTRYAIEGGMNEELAYDLSDCYIRYVYTLEDVTQIMQISVTCAIDYAQRVKQAKIRLSLPVKQCRDYVKAHLAVKITVADLAAHCGRTPEYLSQLFRKELGLSPKEYILQQKLEASREVLLTTNDSISDIALKYGFSTHSKFSQHFKEVYGMSPSDYRLSEKSLVWDAI